MKKCVAFVAIVMLLVACGADPVGKEKNVVAKFEDTRTTFDEKEFKNPIHIELLRELNICEFMSPDSTYFATCTPENFRIIEYKSKGSVRDAFILQMKAGIFPKDQEVPLPPIRHLIVFEREGGKLVRVGGFRGDLIEMRKSDSGAKDLLVGLYDMDDETLFHCLFKWNGKRYEFDCIERLDYGEGLKVFSRSLSEKEKLELTQQIFTQLKDKSLIF
jgi:hypothetical protein